MSFEVVGLGRLLIAMYAEKAHRTSMLREDIRTEIKKSGGWSSSKGGDFYLPFWADAKRHITGEIDLRVATEQRIEDHKGRKRLYELLEEGFLLWWEEKRRLRNIPFVVIDGNIKSRLVIKGLGTVKVENTIAITVGDDGHRVIYPYFCEDPSLSDEAARLGLWVMSQCINKFSLPELRILDVIRGRTFSSLDTSLNGDEDQIFKSRYKYVLDERARLRAEY